MGIADVLSWLHRHSRVTWILLLIYAGFVTFPHEFVQGVVANVAKAIGLSNLYRVALIVGVVCAAALSFVFLRALQMHAFFRLIGAAWLGTFLLILCTWGFLTVNNAELVHYPQYFVPAVMLMAVTLSPLETLAWVTIVGSLDEANQYAAIHGTWGIPFDFNDITMDFLGGALGVVFALAFLPCAARERESTGRFLRRIFSKPGMAIVLGVVVAGLMLYACGKLILYKDPDSHGYWIALSRLRPKSFWYFDETWGPKTFHTLTPVEGPLVLSLLLALYATLDRKLTIARPVGRA